MITHPVGWMFAQCFETSISALCHCAAFLLSLFHL